MYWYSGWQYGVVHSDGRRSSRYWSATLCSHERRRTSVFTSTLSSLGCVTVSVLDLRSWGH